MKKRILSLLLALTLVLTLVPMLVSDAQADTTYSKKVLSINWDLINQVGRQTDNGPCAAYSLAYCRTMLDGEVCKYTSYYKYNGEYWYCNWDSGSYYNGYYTSSELDAYRFLFTQIENGDPVVIRVNAWGSQHYVAVVGYENVKTLESLTASNFLIIDPNGSGGNLCLENLGGKGFFLLADSDGLFQLCYDNTDRTVPAGELLSNCVHKFEEGFCTKCKAAWQPNQNDNASVKTGIYKVKSGTTAYLRVHPYKLSDSAHGEPATAISAKTEVTVTGGVVNGLGHTWYKATCNGKTGYIFADNLTFYKEAPAPAVEPAIPTTRASVAEGTYYLSPACAPGYRLDVAAASCEEGANLHIWEAIDYDAQRFIVHHLGGKLYTITAKHSNMVLDVWAAGTYSGADVRQHPWNGGENEQWFFVDAGDGYYYIRPVHCPSLSLDVSGGDVWNGVNIQIWENNDTNAQKWKLTPCEVPVSGVTVDRTQLSLDVGQRSRLSVTVLPTDATDKTVTWSSSDPAVATVTDGTITAVAPGTATITATSGGKSASCTVTVEKKETLQIGTVSLSDGAVGEAYSQTLIANTADPVTWTVSSGALPDGLTMIGNMIYGTPTRAGTYSFTVTAVCGSASDSREYTITIPDNTPAPAEVHFPRVNVYHQDQFEDVKANQWFTPTVASAFELGLMKGSSATTFKPYGDVTIAEAVTMASRIHSIATTGSENFVQSGKWYQVYLDYAYQNGIIGFAYYNSDVTQKATRAQFAEIFVNSLPAELLPAINHVADNAVPDVSMFVAYSDFVYKLYRAGILAGSDATGTFHPLTYITRAEAATIVSRMAESGNRVSITLG